MIDFNFKLVRAADVNGKSWEEKANQFLVSINGETFDFYMGSQKHEPTLDACLYALCMDAEAEKMTFEEWCQEFGFNSDSIKDLKTYQQCVENGRRLSLAGVDIEAERLRLADF